jgi:DNA-directed RNA polymerase specialized sigma24 family protein
VEEPALQSSSRRKDWTLTASAFHRLLKWLDDSETTSGQSYIELRRRLVAYFDRKECLTAEDLADETLNRVARRLEEEGAIQTESAAKYCYITARFVFMENLRERKKHTLVEEPGLREKNEPSEADNDILAHEKRLQCLDHCSQKLSAVNRDLILRYYIGRQQEKIENRRAMANHLGISINALAIRACRIRERLAACVKQCVDVD